MARVVVLDTSPLGLLCAPLGRPEAKAEECRAWLVALVEAGDEVVVPEIADYELRREMLQNGRQNHRRVASLDTLDQLREDLPYLPITTGVMDLAAEFWAEVRARGRPTADRHALDGDAIFAAQVRLAGGEVVVATSNVDHLARFEGIDARLWSSIG